jgi:uncharacterized OsmC-like protein
MSGDRIRESIDSARRYLAEQPETAPSPDKPAKAVLETGLRFGVAAGDWTVSTDMPSALGGEASAPSPGWLARAALASCSATVIAMRAAELGITLDSLEVTVETESDSRGLLGIGDAAAGPASVRMRVRAAGEGLDRERLHELVEWAGQHSPVGDVFRRSITPDIEVEQAGALVP